MVELWAGEARLWYFGGKAEATWAGPFQVLWDILVACSLTETSLAVGQISGPCPRGYKRNRGASQVVFLLEFLGVFG